MAGQQQLFADTGVQRHRLLLSLLLVRAGLGTNVDLVTIGVLMLLVPGVALTNAMRRSW